MLLRAAHADVIRPAAPLQVVDGRTWHIRRPDNTQRYEKSLLVVLKLVKAGHRRVLRRSRARFRSAQPVSSAETAVPASRWAAFGAGRPTVPGSSPSPSLSTCISASFALPAMQAANSGLDGPHRDARQRAPSQGCRGAPVADEGERCGPRHEGVQRRDQRLVRAATFETC